MSEVNIRRMSGAIGRLFLAAVMVSATSGCAFLESSGSVSDSSGSVSDSASSGSDSSTSSSGGGDQAYHRDVRDFAVAIANAGGDPEALRRGLAEIALGRGVSDWEAVPSTYHAVGEGLANAGLTAEKFLAYRAAIARSGSDGFESINQGYASSLP